MLSIVFNPKSVENPEKHSALTKYCVFFISTRINRYITSRPETVTSVFQLLDHTICQQHSLALPHHRHHKPTPATSPNSPATKAPLPSSRPPAHFHNR